MKIKCHFFYSNMDLIDFQEERETLEREAAEIERIRFSFNSFIRTR